MSRYKDSQYLRQEELIKTSPNIFSGDKGNGFFMGKPRPFVLRNGVNNIYEPIRDKVIGYFKDNGISWWGGSQPSGHTLSSQIACLNHLFSIRDDKESVLAMLNGVRDEFEDVLPISCDAEPQYIGFEVVSTKDHLNEKTSTRGSNCTSVDAFIYAVHKEDKKRWLIPIEWKYTECYSNQDKSNEDRIGEEKGSNGKGRERVMRYSALTDSSTQLKSLNCYYGSIYYQEPFYQLMRQTLWAENVVKHRDDEILKADDYLHIHIIPQGNKDLLDKKYSVSGKGMEETWRGMLNDQSKYVIVDPQRLFTPIAHKYPELVSYLNQRYW
ncbi:MAG: hypothetical protein II216_02855 [Alistipes sp.]|jgi:hypothetical protein|nr:hypothetical protein [Alistipes sp.]MBQ2036837.1 hypothetical protein [Alistipes sp.]MBQ5358363.1 hypothetical protein [Alistipes sp.]MBQ5860921.1 hypothetical protein [Alistipes sp.]